MAIQLIVLVTLLTSPQRSAAPKSSQPDTGCFKHVEGGVIANAVVGTLASSK